MKNSKFSGIAALSLLVASSAHGADRHNIVYIMTDQQSFYMISAITRSLGSAPYGDNPYIKTPNLDRLVKDGYTFSNCYAAHPVSGPSRFALLTGESPNGHGMTGNFSPGGENGEKIMSLVTTRAMGTLFKNAGYQTFYGGKVHLPWANGNSGKGSINEPPYKYGFEKYLTEDDRDVLDEKGVEFFSTYKGKEPFLLFLSFMNPHDICMTKLLFSDKTIDDFKGIDPMDFRARINQLAWRDKFQTMDKTLFKGDLLAKPPFNLPPTDRVPIKFKQVFKLDDFTLRVHIWFYYSLMKQVDAEIGKVLDALENSPYKDNTIIVFTSDHGEMGGSHGLTGKNVPYGECQKVPLIFVGKGVKKGVIDNTTVVCNGWDLLPTMLDLAGIAKPKELKGISLYKTITAGKPVKRKYLYLETVNSYGILENGRYKYTHFMPVKGLLDGDEMFFDLEKDPGELHNLAYDPSYATKLSELRKVLASEMEQRGIERFPAKE
ncbi:MAG: sulfatase-like hydrolase/transferase [Clostridiales bacterium]|jgi:choline-sulfatase|nr:sulfatase-like hydrolase/transferase [Clostridiales bacterium]